LFGKVYFTKVLIIIAVIIPNKLYGHHFTEKALLEALLKAF
jgi:hypothetical protein